MCEPLQHRLGGAVVLLPLVVLSLAAAAAGQEEDAAVFLQQLVGIDDPAAVGTVHVSSIGGVGTTSFMHELHNLNQKVLTNSAGDKDFIKHVPYSKAVASKFFKETKAEKTRSDKMPDKHPKTLEEYARAPDDFLQLEQHFDSFFQQCDYPVAFLQIEEKTEHLRELANFLGRWVEDLRSRMEPWHIVKKAEEEKEEEAAGKLTPKSLANLTAVAKPAAGDETPTQEIKDLLTAKFRNLTAKYRMLSGFKAFRPKDCNMGKRLPAPTGAAS